MFTAIVVARRMYSCNDSLQQSRQQTATLFSKLLITLIDTVRKFRTISLTRRTSNMVATRSGKNTTGLSLKSELKKYGKSEQEEKRDKEKSLETVSVRTKNALRRALLTCPGPGAVRIRRGTLTC